MCVQEVYILYMHQLYKYEIWYVNNTYTFKKVKAVYVVYVLYSGYVKCERRLNTHK